MIFSQGINRIIRESGERKRRPLCLGAKAPGKFFYFSNVGRFGAAPLLFLLVLLESFLYSSFLACGRPDESGSNESQYVSIIAGVEIAPASPFLIFIIWSR